MKIIFPFICLLFITCTSTDIYINKNGVKGSVRKILIADFEKRYMKFDPFISGNFQDALQFEFLKLGYKVEIISRETRGEEDTVAKLSIEDCIKDYVKKSPSDLVIRGVISEKEYGDAINAETSTSIVLHLYNRLGEKIGETRCISSYTLENAKNIKSISKSLAEKIYKEL